MHIFIMYMCNNKKNFLSYYHYLAYVIFLRKSTWIYSAIYILVLSLILYIIPKTFDANVIELWGDTSLLIQQLIIYVNAIIASLVSITIFKESWENGSDLLIISKPITRHKMILAKSLILFTYILVISLLGAISSIFIIFDSYVSMVDYWSLFSSILIANIYIFCILSFVASIVCLFLNKTWTVLLVVIITIFFSSYNLISSIISPSFYQIAYNNKRGVYSGSDFIYDGDTQLKTAVIIPDYDEKNINQDTIIDFFNKISLSQQMQFYNDNNNNSGIVFDFLTQYNMISNLFSLNISNFQYQYNNFASSKFVNYKIHKNNYVFDSFEKLPYMISYAPTLSVDLSNISNLSQSIVYQTCLDSLYEYNWQWIFNSESWANDAYAVVINKKNNYEYVYKTNPSGYWEKKPEYSKYEEFIFSELIKIITNDTYDGQQYTFFKNNGAIIPTISNNKFNISFNSTWAESYDLNYPYNSLATNLTDFLHSVFTNNMLVKNAFTNNNDINMQIPIVKALNINNTMDEMHIFSKFKLFTIEYIKKYIYENKLYETSFYDPIQNDYGYSPIISPLYCFKNNDLLPSVVDSNTSLITDMIFAIQSGSAIDYNNTFNDLFLNTDYLKMATLAQYLNSTTVSYSSLDSTNFTKNTSLYTGIGYNNGSNISTVMLSYFFEYDATKVFFVTHLLAYWLLAIALLFASMYVAYYRVDYK